MRLGKVNIELTKEEAQKIVDCLDRFPEEVKKDRALFNIRCEVSKELEQHTMVKYEEILKRTRGIM